MTSSLVGSEMCIRDSCTSRPRRSIQEHATGRDSSPHTKISPMQRMAPVSYTHLTLPTICSV
eukprot:1838366-Prorocentrum_lima.AAC.1